MRLFFSFLIKNGAKQLIELVGFDAQQSFLSIDNPLFDHVNGDSDGGETRSFASASLQHPKLAALDSEFDVLHFAVMLF